MLKGTEILLESLHCDDPFETQASTWTTNAWYTFNPANEILIPEGWDANEVTLTTSDIELPFESVIVIVLFCVQSTYPVGIVDAEKLRFMDSGIPAPLLIILYA